MSKLCLIFDVLLPFLLARGKGLGDRGMPEVDTSIATAGRMPALMDEIYDLSDCTFFTPSYTPLMSFLTKAATYFHFLRSLYSDPRTPTGSRVLPFVALLYFISPVDFIPDLIPLLGQLDDVTVVPFLLILAFSLISKHVKTENWSKATGENVSKNGSGKPRGEVIDV